MIRRFTTVVVIALLVMLLPFAACNRSAAPDAVGELANEDELMQQAASEADSPVAPPTTAPTEEPTAEPTEEPTIEPTAEPTEEPIAEPTVEPTEEPTVEPTEEPTVEPTAEAPVAIPGEHVVQPGENLFRIALRYGTMVESLAQANGITNPTLIYVGQVLKIPGGTAAPAAPMTTETVHVVQPGENLFRIALNFNMDFYYLARYNGITNPALVYAGQAINIPAH